MDDHPESIFSLEPFEHGKEIIQATAEQIQKDFGEFSFTIRFTGKIIPPYKELYDELHPIIENLLQTESRRLTSLLYRIDVSAAAIKKSSAIFPTRTLSEIITDQIIRRELLKVLYRKHYKK